MQFLDDNLDVLTLAVTVAAVLYFGTHLLYWKCPALFAWLH
jgi:hypothetical protein